MIAAMGYQSPTAPSFKDKLSMGFSSPLRLRSSIFVSSRRPSIPLSPTLLPLLSFPPTSGQKIRPVEPSQPHNATCQLHDSTPIHQLPVEILCDIFCYCELGSGDAEYGAKVILSHVCRRWRAIALCMPMLWTNISIRNPNSTSIDKIRTYLRRSGSCPISLCVIECFSSSSGRSTAIEGLWSVVRSHFDRLRSIRLELRSNVQGLVDSLTECQFPSLDTLDLHLHCCPTTLSEKAVSVFQHGSSLSSFIWKGAEDLPANISWSTLSRVELNGAYTLGTICHILQHCHNVEDLSLKSITDGNDVSLPTTIIALPALRNLIIHTHINLTRLFNQLHVPFLRKIHIRHRLTPDILREPRAFGNMLLRSGCKLEKLVFRDKTIDDTQFIEYLRLPALQSLSALHIHHPAISDRILRTLSTTPEDGLSCALPQLESINLFDCRSSDGLLEDFLRSRMVELDQKSLKHLEVGLTGMHVKDEAYLRSLQSAGLNVHYHH